MASVVCIAAPNIPDALVITVPGAGEIQFIKDSIDKIPRASDYILKALNNMSPILSPVYTVLRIMDVLIAVIDCVKGIPKILPANPKPIIDCFQGLFKALAALIPLLPPFAYIKLVADLVGAIKSVIDDLIQVLSQIDAQISAVKAVFERAQTENDTVLLQIGNCAQEDLVATTASAFQILEAIGKLMTIFTGLLEIIAAVLPGGAGAKIQQIIDDLDAVTGAISAVDPSATDFPPLNNMLQGMLAMRAVLEFVESFCNAILGASFEFTTPDIPTFENP